MRDTRKKTMERALRRALMLVAFAALVGCDGGMGGDFEPGEAPGGGAPGGGAAPGGGDLGATPGGAQDIGIARQLIAEGRVPRADAFLVEGLLSEHDLPVAGAPCDSLLCVRPAVGIGTDLDTGEPTYWAHLAMSSGVNSAEFTRPPMDAVIVVDRSASMSIDMVETNAAVEAFIAHMTPRDRLAVLAVNTTVDTVHPLRAVADASALQAEVRAISATGGWDVEAGVREGLRLLEPHADDPARMRRIVVLSCGMPAAGPGSSFAALADRGARAEIGLSFYGVLLGYDATLAGLLGRTAGGIFGYLQNLADVERVFDTDFDFLVTPVAYDLDFRFAPATGFEVETIYGLPGEPDAEGRRGFSVKTAFFSRRKGAIVVKLAQTGTHDGALGQASLRYRPNTALGFTETTPQEARMALAGDGAETHFDGRGVRKAVALVTLVDHVRQALESWHGGARDAARARMDRLVAHLEAEAAALEDDGLAREAALCAKLRANMD